MKAGVFLFTIFVAYVGASPFFNLKNLFKKKAPNTQTQTQVTYRRYQQPRRYSYSYKKPQTYYRSSLQSTQYSPQISTRTSFINSNSKPALNGRILVEFNNDNKKIDIDKQVEEALTVPVVKDTRITAEVDRSSPSAAAALAYMKEAAGKDGLCGIPTEVFIETILAGKSREIATAEATRVYLEAYNRGERLPVGGPCEKADIAWRQAVVDDKDPVLESALAFIKAWPGVIDGNPCAVAGVDYIKAILSGKSHLEANQKATASFAKSFKKLAEAGKPLKDEACLSATYAFWEAIPDSQKPDPANAKAFVAFADKIFNENAKPFDPVCLASLNAFFESFGDGDDLLTANLKSARAFFKEFQKGKSRVPADSACAAATLAYAEEIQKTPSGPNAAGMIAYIAEAIRSGERKLDPVCGEATLAYWDAYVDSKNEAAANEAAAIGYLEALEDNPNFDQTSACAKAAEAYIAEFS